jgi:ABC-type transport system involved in cytochrome c biogenesis permease subunit
MEGLVKLSFYSFTAASIALGAALVGYIIYAIGRIRVRRATMATTAGTTVTATTAEFGPGSVAAGRFGTLLAWFAVVFQGCSVLLRTIAAERGPYSNMYEFSLAFIFAVTLIYLIFERMYAVKQLGAIVMAIAFGMAL